MNMNILLTGSGGFIGSNLKKHFAEKFNLFTPRSAELDLCDKKAVKEYFSKRKIDLVIHCASVGGARGITDSTDTLEKNLLMFNNILSCKNESVRVITFGSGAMYGKHRQLHKVCEREIGEIVPKDLYGLSKMEIAKLVEKRNDVLCLNIFACYGYDEKDSRFPSYAINCVINHKPIIINQNVIFDYLWVEDMVKIVEFFVNNKIHDKIINITPSLSISLEEIAKIVNNLSGINNEIIIKNTKLGNEYTGENSLLLEHLKDFEFTSYEIGLSKLYNHIRTIGVRNEQ